MDSRVFRQLVYAFLAILCFGTIGYRQIEGWSFLDSLFMTVITITTVGFREVGWEFVFHPKSHLSFEANDHLIFMGPAKSIEDLYRLSLK
jgi:hypothetical protein